MNVKACNVMVPENIVRLINERGMKQRAVAERAGFTDQQMCDMLNGRKIIKVCDTLAIAEALGVEVAELYTAGQRGA